MKSELPNNQFNGEGERPLYMTFHSQRCNLALKYSKEKMHHVLIERVTDIVYSLPNKNKDA